jgi:hypothetical protein
MLTMNLKGYPIMENYNTSETTNKNRPRTLVTGYFFDDCIQDLVARNRINIIKIDGGDPDSYYSFPLSIMYRLTSPDIFVKEIEVPLSKAMITDYPDFFRHHYAKFWSFYDRYSVILKYSRYDQTATYFNLVYRYYYHCLQTNNIDLLIMSEIPHFQGHNYILYEIAQILNIKTILLHPAPFDNKSFIISSPDAMLNHDLLIPIESNQHIELKITSPYYMDETLKIHKNTQYLSSLTRPIQFIFNIVILFYYGFRNVFEATHLAIKRVHTNNAKIFRSKLCFQMFCKGIRMLVSKFANAFIGARHLDLLAQIAKNVNQIDLNTPFVYFPLHYQPELTTGVLGDVYENQLYAAECIAKLLPDDWKIYIKDHPAQGITQRNYPNYWRTPSFFFSRIQKNPKLILIDSSIDTNLLIQKSTFVATICGTVGWESLLSGKQVLIFGTAWYGKFSGCTIYTPEITLENILNNKINLEKLQQSVDFLANCLANGIIGRDAILSVENFDIKQNATSIADAIEKYIDNYFSSKE